MSGAGLPLPPAVRCRPASATSCWPAACCPTQRLLLPTDSIPPPPPSPPAGERTKVRGGECRHTMPQRRIRAVFMRGGTSRALFFHAADLPPDPPARDRSLLAALGS